MLLLQHRAQISNNNTIQYSNELLNSTYEYAYINNKTKTCTQYLLKKTKKTKKTIVILKFSMKFQTKLKYESNLKHSSSRSII
jgi:hypothetical protein